MKLVSLRIFLSCALFALSGCNFFGFGGGPNVSKSVDSQNTMGESLDTHFDTGQSNHPISQGLSHPICLEGKSITSDFLKNGTGNLENFDQAISDKFFINKEVQTLIQKGEILQLCFSGRDALSFTIHGVFAGGNNLIGIFGDEGLWTDIQDNPNSGDIGVCRIDGYLERNLVYSCGGGDGPGGWNKVFVMAHGTGKSTLIKSCKFDGSDPQKMKTSCSVNTLSLPEYPF